MPPEGHGYLKVCVPREITPGERRVALVPDPAAKLVSAGFEVAVESGAGNEAYLSDSQYADAGVSVAGSAGELLGDADVVLKVRKPVVGDGVDEVQMMPEGCVLIALLEP